MNDIRDSTLVRMQERYWATKQAVFKKLGKKDDDCIVASDAELDTKLELFQTIEESFLTLMRVLESYQEKLCAFAQEENAMGRFLKENGKQDKTRAGKVMMGAGKALSYSAQQKLSLRMPLIRLYQEVETFQYRAIVDTLQTVDKMEKARTAYRGALMWMKDVSQQLDPDTCKQLEKFRKVQSHVRKSKARFDKLKLDTLEKVDLLSFSRCNLFSQALSFYQNALINISKKISHATNSVAETTKGYHFEEFSVLKELTEISKKVAEKSSLVQNPLPVDDKDALLFFESEYHDEVEKSKDKNKSDSSPNKEPLSPISNNSLSSKRKTKKKKSNGPKENENSDVPLLSLDNDEEEFDKSLKDLNFSHDSYSQQNLPKDLAKTKDLLMENFDDDLDKSNLTLLEEILDSNNDFTSKNHLETKWLSASGPDDNLLIEKSENANLKPSLQSASFQSCFLPSHLLDMTPDYSKLQNDFNYNASNSASSSSKIENDTSLEKNKKGKQDMSSWFNLFADLDPLANPDLIGKKKEHDDSDC